MNKGKRVGDNEIAVSGGTPATGSETESTDVNQEVSNALSEANQSLQIKEELIDGCIQYTLNAPVSLPYDEGLVHDITKESGNIPLSSFTNVLRNFLENTLPDIFPKGFYEMSLDDRTHRITINPTKNDDFQYCLGIDCSRKEDVEIDDDLPEQYKSMSILTGVSLTSKIFHPGTDDPVTNGFFPRVEYGEIQPIEGVKIKATYTDIELPSILYDEDRVYIHQISIPILQTLLTQDPLFFPGDKISTGYINGRWFPKLKLKASDSATIGQGRDFRNKLSGFLAHHRDELKALAEEFSEAKAGAKIPVDRSLQDYDSKFLYDHFNGINSKIEKLREKLDDDLRLG